ncbi:FG-GAP repeat protein [Sorangium sp. So ce321]|uniref:FG-GAP repeat protein n=1 Tax=Sorangium sp. So ce321 TaxID=3133300 RepID=UPI003F60BD72
MRRQTRLWAQRLVLFGIGSMAMACSDAERTDGREPEEAQAAHSALLAAQRSQLLASDRDSADLFGFSSDIDGDTAVIGALGKDGHTGAAYVFVRSGGTWTEQAKLSASDGAPGDYFGRSVSISGDTVLVGGESNAANGTDAGAAYVFVRSGTTWTQQAKLIGSDVGVSDFSGVAVALDGDTALIGTSGDDDAFTDAGAVYVFTRSGTTWTEQDKLVADDPTAPGYFGSSIALSGNRALIGAPFTGTGKVYSFVRVGSTWTQEDVLAADDGQPDDYFGKSLALAGDRALIGAPNDDDIAFNSGAAYVFARDGSTWTQEAKLTSERTSSLSDFGAKVALTGSGNRAFVGASSDNDLGSDAGAVHSFLRAGTSWAEEELKLVAADGGPVDLFGSSLTVSGSTLFVGAYFYDVLGFNEGTTYAYTFSDGGFRSIETTIDSTTVALPEGCLPGDLLLAALEVVADPPDVTPPSGFTLVHDQSSSTSDGPFHAMVYTKVVGSSEPAEYTFDVPVGVWVDIHLACYSGVSSAVASAGASATGPSISAPSVTPSSPGGILVTFFSGYSYGTWSTPAGLTQRSDVDSNSIQDQVITTASATGARTATSSGDPNGLAAVSVILQ